MSDPRFPPDPPINSPDPPDPNPLIPATPYPPGYVAEPSSDSYMASLLLNWGEADVDTNPPV